MFWVAFQGYNNGKALSLGTIEQAEAESFGMHGYPTKAQAEAKPNIVPPIAKAQVNGWVFNEQGSASSHLINQVPGASQVKGAVTDINTFLSRLTSPNLWLRIGEFILGALLILSGTLKLTNHNGDITQLVKTGLKVAK